MADRDSRLRSQSRHPSYEEDFGAWLDAQVELLRTRRFDELDLANLIEEVEGVGKSDFRSFVSAIELIILHMMKWDYQTERQGRSWRTTIHAQRNEVMKLLEDSPSYKSRIDEAVARAYRVVPHLVENETGVPADRLPRECPYRWEEIMTRLHDLDPDRPWPN